MARNEARIRSLNGETQFFCYVCSEWKSASAFEVKKSRARCRACRAVQRRAYGQSDRRREQARKRATTITRQMQLADQRRSPADPWRRNRPVVSLELVRGWLDRAFTLHGESWSAVSLATGVAERTLYRVRLNDQQGVAVDVAEAVASSIGAMEEFREAVQPGVEGWGPDSRYCQRCGRYDLPHHAKNLCRRCYQTTWYWTNVMKRPTPPPIAERWSRSHEKCVECGTTELRHQALGRCNPCYRRLQKRRNRNG